MSDGLFSKEIWVQKIFTGRSAVMVLLQGRKGRMPMTNRQFGEIALHACQWSTAVLQQGRRFLNAFKTVGGKLPWDEDEESGMFLADRVFLITAMNHAITNLEYLNDELVRRGDDSFSCVLNAIATQEERKKIQVWRNMNEHDTAYIVGQGRKQQEFISTYEKNDFRVRTNAFFTYLNGNEHVFLIGSIEIDQLLLKFKNNLPQIKTKTKEIFDSSFFQDD
ncbi:MAG: hypothetical protein RR295_02630 [Oscillospiraceae bacterium]